MGGGGSGGGGGPSTSTVTNTNIPEYARPYVETMLGATQQQLFNTRQGPSTTNPFTGETTPGATEITGIKPFKAFGSDTPQYTWDPNTRQLGVNYVPVGMGEGEMRAARAAVAEQDPLQQKAYRAAAEMQTPGAYGQALESAQTGIGQALGAGQQYGQMATSPEAMKSYMSPYMQNVVDAQKQAMQRDADIKSAQLKGQAIQQGRFGGSRTALEQAQLSKDLASRMDLAQATGLQNAFQNAQQAQQFQSTLGLQGAQAGTGGASQLAGIAGQQLGAEQGILGLQGQMGAGQQAYNQSIINQAIQNYANAQQNPQQQLAFMNAMLRGLPMQSTTTQSYQAAPSAMSQLAGLGTAGYGAYKMFGSKKGGVIKDNKPAGLAALALDKMGA